MFIQDLRIYLSNAIVIGLSLSNMDEVLRLLLLAVSIGYTTQRWFLMVKKNKNEKSK